MRSLLTITVAFLWFALLAIGHARAQCGFDRAVAVGMGQTAVRGVAVAPDGSVIVCGTFEDSTRIGTTTLVRRFGPAESFLARYSADLELLWAIDMRGAREVRGITVDSLGNIYVVGWGGDFLGSIRVVLNPKVATISSLPR